jgi:hypothetical protein
VTGLIVSSYLSFCVWLAAQFASRFLSALHGDDSSDDGDDEFEAEEARRREDLMDRIRYGHFSLSPPRTGSSAISIH